MIKLCGIYKITNLLNNKVLVGSGINLAKRKVIHFSTLRKNKHHNPHLQSSYNIYGETSFVFEVIEECKESELYLREGFWVTKLKTLNPSYGYNKIFPGPGRIGSVTSEETKQKLRLKLMGNKHRLGTMNLQDRKPVLQLTLNGVLVQEYDFIHDTKRNGFNPAHVCEVCKGVHKSHKGYFWKYKDN